MIAPIESLLTRETIPELQAELRALSRLGQIKYRHLLAQACGLDDPNDSLAVVQAILEIQPEWINAKHANGHPALEAAISKGHVPVITFLAEQGAQPEWTKGTHTKNALTWALERPGAQSHSCHEVRRAQDVVEAVLKCFPVKQARKDTALLYAVQHHALGGARALVKHGAALTARWRNSGDDLGNTLMAACNYAQPMIDRDGLPLLNPMIEALLSSKKAHKAINQGWEENDIGATALHLAAGSGNLPVIKALVDSGACVDVPEAFEGQQLVTPLMAAASECKAGALALLIDLGANPHAIDDQNENALHHLAYTTPSDDEESHALRINEAMMG